LELWKRDLKAEGFWHERGCLRREIRDIQISGYGYSALGILCCLFVEHAPEARGMKARWEGIDFCWDGEKPGKALGSCPFVVSDWWGRHHRESEMLWVLALTATPKEFVLVLDMLAENVT
jgi:hypothetical protein